MLLIILSISLAIAWFIDRTLLQSSKDGSTKKYTDLVEKHNILIEGIDKNDAFVAEIRLEVEKQKHVLNIAGWLEDGDDLKAVCNYINKYYGDKIMYYTVIEVTDKGVHTRFLNNEITITHKNYVIQVLQQLISTHVQKTYV